MNLHRYSHKDIGKLGEEVACEYLKQQGFIVIARNIAKKSGELDVVARKTRVLHIVEVKTILCESFLDSVRYEKYGPEENLHAYKIRKVARTAEWYMAEIGWEGEWQIDAVPIWLRAGDAMAKICYLPQIIQ